MNENLPIDSEELGFPGLTTLAAGFVVCALATALAWFGGSTAAGQLVVYSILATAVGLILIASVLGRAPLRWSWAYVPMVLFVVLAVAQTITLPVAYLSFLSAGSVELRNKFRAVTDLGRLSRGTLSLYAFAAWTDLRTILCAIATWLVIFQVAKTRKRISQLLLVISCLGLLTGLFALGQAALGIDTIYGLIKASHKSSGPFMNHSHFSQFMNLAIGASIAWLLIRIPAIARGGELSLIAIREDLAYEGQYSAMICLGTILVGMAAIANALSRTGIIAMLISSAAVVLFLLLLRGGSARLNLIGAVGIALFGVILIFGVDPLISRLETLRHIETEDGGRWRTVKDLIGVWKSMPLVGTGLGTFSYIYPMYDTTNVTGFATHAEIEYAQLLAETGVAGFFLFLCFLGFVGTKLVRLLRERDPLLGCGIGLGYGLLAVMIQSCTDFGQHGLAVAIESAFLLALLVAAADIALLGQRRLTLESARRPIYQLSTLACALLLLIVMGCLWPSSLSAARAEPLWQDVSWAQLEESNSAQSPSIYPSLEHDLRMLCSLEPENINFRCWKTLVAWQTTPRAVNAAGTEVTFNNADVERLIAEFVRETELCPTYGRAYWMAGQLEYQILGRSGGVKLLRLAYDLSRNSPGIALELAAIDLDQKQPDRALDEMHRAISLKSGLVSNAIQMCLSHEGGESLAYSLAKGKAVPLIELASSLTAAGKSPDLAAQCQDQAQRLLEVEVASANPLDDPSTYVLLAELYRAKGRLADAIQLYQKATNEDYSRVEWHMALADLLKQNGDLAAARRQASICLMLRPGMPQASALLAALNSSG